MKGKAKKRIRKELQKAEARNKRHKRSRKKIPQPIEDDIRRYEGKGRPMFGKPFNQINWEVS